MSVLHAAGGAVSAVARVAEETTEFDPDQVTPGVAGFFALAALAIGIILLGFNLVSRLRRNTYRAEVRERIAEELAEQNGSGKPADAVPDPDTASDPDTEPDPDTKPDSGTAPDPGADSGADSGTRA